MTLSTFACVSAISSAWLFICAIVRSICSILPLILASIGSIFSLIIAFVWRAIVSTRPSQLPASVSVSVA